MPYNIDIHGTSPAIIHGNPPQRHRVPVHGGDTPVSLYRLQLHIEMLQAEGISVTHLVMTPAQKDHFDAVNPNYPWFVPVQVEAVL